MSFDSSRFDRAYFDAEAASLACSAMVISSEIYNILAGNSPGAVALPYVDMISVERSMEQLAGTLHIGFMSATFPITGLSQGSKITVEAGIRYAGKVASQKIFHGRVEKITYPSAGSSVRAYLDAYDAGKDLMDEPPGVGQNTGTGAANMPPRISGDVSEWITPRLADLATVGVVLYMRAAPVIVPNNTHDCPAFASCRTR